MNTLEISKPLTIDFGLRVALSKRIGRLFLTLEDWRHRSRQSELDAYLGQSLNLADLERRMREAQYSQGRLGQDFF